MKFGQFMRYHKRKNLLKNFPKKISFYFLRIVCKKEFEEVKMLILIYFDNFAITYPV